MKRKILSILLVFCLAFCFVGCSGGESSDKKKEQETLATPINLTVTEVGNRGVVRWNPVEHAQKYVVTINDDRKDPTFDTYIYLESLTMDYTISVVATAEGYKDSAPATTTFTGHEITVDIAGGSDCKSGKTLQLTATVAYAPSDDVTWEITEGGEHATIDKNGLITAKEVADDKIIKVRATSKDAPAASKTKTITITAKTELTQAMLDELNVDKISFDGSLEIALYSFGIVHEYDRTITYNVNTSMDGTHWFGKYMTEIGESRLYCQNIGGVANNISVSYMNEAKSKPMRDEDDAVINWADAGLTNGLKGLTTADFTFNEDTWLWEYTGNGKTAEERKQFMISALSAANPYEFEPKSLSLIIEGGVIGGIKAQSEADRSIVQQREAIMTLQSAINIGDAVGDVPVLESYERAEWHDDLTAAVNKMQALDSYTMEYLNSSALAMTQAFTYSGYVETVTDKVCNMRPYVFTPNRVGDFGIIGNGTRTFTGADMGFVARSADDTAYDSYYVEVKTDPDTAETTRTYNSSRKFNASFAEAKPSFAFSADIFTNMTYDSQTKKTTYYADSAMMGVASTFYKGVGNDFPLYGMFANTTASMMWQYYPPFVVVNEQGYIESARFLYDLGELYGMVDMKYSDFNTATVDADVTAALDALAPRVAPASWNDVEIVITESEIDDDMQNMLTFLNTMFGDTTTSANLPFFNTVLGDTYGFAQTTLVGQGSAYIQAAVIYYDVPLEFDYTIDESMAKVENLLKDNGFTKTGEVYKKDKISVRCSDDGLDFTITVWNNSPKTA